MITPEPVSAYVGQLAGKQAGNALGRIMTERMWGRRTAKAALKEVPRPRPVRPLTRWLKRPATLKYVLSSSDRPGAPVVAAVDAALCQNGRWAALPGEVRAARAHKVAHAAYDAVLSSHTPAWSTRIASARNAEKLDKIYFAIQTHAAGTPATQSTEEVGNRDLLEARLSLLPPDQHESVLAAWSDDQDKTWKLVSALTSLSIDPLVVVKDWASVLPPWLVGAAPTVLVATAELAVAYSQIALGRELFLTAARRGGSPRQVLFARAALLYDLEQRDQALAVLSESGTPQESPEPFVRALHAYLSRDWDLVRTVLDVWAPETHRERARKWLIADRTIFLSGGTDTVTPAMISESADLARSLLAANWSNGPALTLVQRLTFLTAMSASEQPYADLREAQDLAIRVRNECRVWRGDSAPAVAAACEAALHAGDMPAVVDLGSSTGQATPREAAHPDVLARVAVASALLGRPVEDTALAVLPEHDRERVLAQMTRTTGDFAASEEHWRAALNAAQDDSERATALAGLARTGTLDLPGLAEFEAEHPGVGAQIRAVGELARGEHAEAVGRLRGRARQNAQAAALLAQAYEEAGDVDAAVATFQEAARTFSDPDLAWAAVIALFRSGRHPEASDAVGALLASAPGAWPGRAQALHMAAQLAADAGDLVAATDLLKTAVELDPSDAARRWQLIQVLLSRTETAAAWRVYTNHPEPLEPRDLAQAHAWLVLQRAEGDPEELARGAIRLTRMFPDDEDLAARAVALLISPNPRTDSTPLPPELLSEVHALVSDYTRRWPEGAIRAITIDEEDPEAMLAQMGEMVRRSPESHKALLQLAGQVARQELPLGMLAAAVHRRYAEIIVQRGLGLLQAGHPDPAEQLQALTDARAALGSTCLADTSAFAVLSLLPGDHRDALIGAFRSVESVDETLTDALLANEGLGARSTLTLGWDAQAGRPSVTEIPEWHADRLAEEASRLLALVTSLHRRPSRQTESDDAAEAGHQRYSPWMPTAETAAAEGRAVWADDGGLRTLVRAIGAPAFGTAELLEVLVEQGTISEEVRTAALVTMVRRGVWAPLPPDEIRKIAQEDDWKPAGAAAVLANPALWLRPQEAHTLLADLLPLVAEHRPEHAPAWLRLCARAIGYAHPGPLVAATVSGGLLAVAVHLVQAEPAAVPGLLTAVRDGLAEAAPDPDVIPDPLAAFGRLILQVTETANSGDSDGLPLLFQALDEDDRALLSDLVNGS